MLILQKVYIKSFRKSQFPDKSVNLSFIITNMHSKLTDLCGNRFLQCDFMNTFCEINVDLCPLPSEGGSTKTLFKTLT